MTEDERREQNRQRQRKYRDKHREKVRERQREYRKRRNPGRDRLNGLRYREKHREEIRRRDREKYWKTRTPHVPKTKAKNYHRNYRLNYLFGITLEEKEQLIRHQDGLCTICRSPFVNAKHAHVDHNHNTGQIRSILCNKCNTGIGQFRDSPELLERAALYLRALS